MADVGSAWFNYRLDGGKTQTDSITIANDSSSTKRVAIYPVDATATHSGALAMRNKSEPRHNIGAWITLSASSLTLKPFEHRDIAFSIAIPPNTSVGDQVGGIIIQDESPVPTTTKQGVHIQVVSRLGVRVYETIPGTPKRELAIIDFRVSSSVRTGVTLTLTNTGNTTIQPRGSVLLKGLLGLKLEALALPPMTLLPQRTATIELTSARRHYLANVGQAKLNLIYANVNVKRSLSYTWLNKAAILIIVATLILGISVLKIFHNDFTGLLYSYKKQQKRGDNENTNRRG